MMKSRACSKNSRRVMPVKIAAHAKKRSQLIETVPSKQIANFEAWLLHMGVSPKSGQPVSQIGIYTDFN